MDKQGTLRNVKGDVRNPQISAENEVAIIPHCCNNLGVMGAGVALALKNKWPEVFEIYKRLEQLSPNGWKNRLHGFQHLSKLIDFQRLFYYLFQDKNGQLSHRSSVEQEKRILLQDF